MAAATVNQNTVNTNSEWAEKM